MTIVAHAHPFVVGVDTHARSHTLAVVASSGQVLDTATFPTTTAGLGRAIAWAGRRTGGDLDTLWVIEGAASYGAGLGAHVEQRGYQVVEAPRMNPRAAAGGKSDPLDAARIAAAVLPLDTDRLRHPRQGDGVRAALRVLLAAREQMSTQRTSTINALIALVRIVDLGIDARRPLTRTQIHEISRWRTRTQDDLATATARAEATRLAKHAVDLQTQLAANTTRMNELVQASPAAPLLTQTGIGPVTAATALTTWSHHGRIRSEAGFAALAGVNPIPASSGNTVRHRLNRGGDRRLNRALHIATVTRMTHDPTTRAYVERRRTEGRTTPEIRRCLKRYLARHIYRTLNATTTT